MNIPPRALIPKAFIESLVFSKEPSVRSANAGVRPRSLIPTKANTGPIKAQIAAILNPSITKTNKTCVELAPLLFSKTISFFLSSTISADKVDT